MKTQTPQTIYLKDYRPPHFLIDTVDLNVDLGEEWTTVKEVITSEGYLASTNPVKPEYIFTVPIHQRNTNFKLKVTSDFPYPVSLVSMMWEGNYSPRYYRRA